MLNEFLARERSSCNDETNGRSRTPAKGCPLGVNIYAEAQKEFDLIRSSHRTLAPTGCTPQFCQSGRATRTFEPRVGRDRPLEEIQREAEEFLQECRDVGVIESDALLDQRISEALAEISETSVETLVAHGDGHVHRQPAGGVWYQTREELEYGLRAAWRNARRCIMRSEHEHLALCDLRHVHSSQSMAAALLSGLQKAFNQGRVLPTAFVFPPRLPGKRGPMLWNDQILAFAGYKQADGSILGDPKNVELTAAVMELGWSQPHPRTNWDLLPLVTMADGESPYMTELPHDLRRLVSITHPRYQAEFEELDLKWVMFPALSRLGFDIGGVQYTASPFVGWFMDAEVGVRNLADSFRYNALPNVARALRLVDEPGKLFADLPEYLRTAALLRAQAELNLAVYHSFLQERITMTDTMTCSIKYQQYDNQRRDELGYRLPADPYWLAPPQGSIIPLWHQGAAPNYQPKPMIVRHVQDPVKAWRRENPSMARVDDVDRLTRVDDSRGRPKIMIFTCSAGVTAGKLATRLHSTLARLARSLEHTPEVSKARPLNSLDLGTCCSSDIVFVIASTTGRGEMPRNAHKFIANHKDLGMLRTTPRFSIYANGDSTYGDTYNAAAKQIESTMTGLGCKDMLNHVFAGDTASHNPDWESFNHWLSVLSDVLMGQECKVEPNMGCFADPEKPTAPANIHTAFLVEKHQLTENGLILLTLDIGEMAYREMDHVKIMTPNPRSSVAAVLRRLGLANGSRFTWHDEDAYTFISRYVDVELPFKTLAWYPDFSDLPTAHRHTLSSQSVIDVLNPLDLVYDPTLIERICKDMSSIMPRLYSVASSPSSEITACAPRCSRNQLQVVVKVNEGGRFSDVFLSQAKPGDGMRFGLTSPDTWNLVQSQKPTAPLIAFVTGSGMGPVRALLQRRIADLSGTSEPESASGARRKDISKKVVEPCDRVHLQAQMTLGGFHGSLDAEIAAPWRNLFVSSRLKSQAESAPESVPSIAPVSATDTQISGHALNADDRAHAVGKSSQPTVSLFVGYKQQDEQMIEELLEPAQRMGILDVLEKCPSNPAKIRIQDHLLKRDVQETLLKHLRDPSCIVLVCANNHAADGYAENLSKIYGSDIREALGGRYIEEVFRG